MTFKKKVKPKPKPEALTIEVDDEPEMVELLYRPTEKWPCHILNGIRFDKDNKVKTVTKALSVALIRDHPDRFALLED